MPRFWRPIVVDGNTIRRIRSRLKLTQTELGERVGVCKRTVIRWEKHGAKFDRYSIGSTWRSSPFTPLKELADRCEPKVRMPRVG